MKVRAIWEFDADVSDISSEHVDVEGHAKDLAKNELSWWMSERGCLFADEFTFEVVKESPEDERSLYNSMCCSAINENIIYATQEMYERMRANRKNIIVDSKGKPRMVLKVIKKGND